jgi:hypothetical protein
MKISEHGLQKVPPPPLPIRKDKPMPPKQKGSPTPPPIIDPRKK